MRKIVVLTFDDGTVYDKGFVEMLNRLGIPATFNLNSGLEDFVWHYEDRHPIHRLKLWENRDLYTGHEVASHTLTHPYLTGLSENQLLHEVGEDCWNLSRIFNIEGLLGFGVPFDQCTEREIGILRESGLVRYIRLSEFREDFSLPEDPFHIRINALYNDPDVWAKLKAFRDSKEEVAVFVLCGHSYEFEVCEQWGMMEDLLETLRNIPGVEFMTTMDLVKTFYP